MTKKKWFVIRLIGNNDIVVLSKMFDSGTDACNFYNNLYAKGDAFIVTTIDVQYNKIGL